MLAMRSFAQAPALLNPPPGSPWDAPPDAKSEANPMPSNADSLRKGRVVFKEYCATCHGDRGLGDGSARKTIEMTLPNLQDKAWAAARTDGELFWKISTGRLPMMPYDPLLRDEDRWHVVNYVRNLSSDSPFAEPDNDELKITPTPQPTPENAAPAAAAKRDAPSSSPKAEKEGVGLNQIEVVVGLLAGVIAVGLWIANKRRKKS